MLDAPNSLPSYVSIFITHFFGTPAENLEFLRKLYLDFELSSHQIAELTGWSRTSMKNERVLLENHLEFLRTHRGTVTKQADHWIVESDKKEFTFLIVGSTPIPETIQISTFYKTPWSGASNATWLKSNKKHTHTLSYMILDKKQLKTEPFRGTARVLKL